MTSIIIYLPNGMQVSTKVTPTMTVKQLLDSIDFPQDNIIVYNSGDTPYPDLNRTMVDYNNWYVEDGYIPSIYLRYAPKEDDEKLKLQTQAKQSW